MMSSSSEIANPATHSALDFFEKPSLLISYDNAYDQIIETQTGCAGPTLEFNVTADNRNCVDLNCIFLNALVSLRMENGTNKPVAADDQVVFANNLLHSLFVNCEIYLNGTPISNSNNFYAHAAFIETEYSLSSDCKNSWVKCQGYSYETNPNDFTSEVFKNRHHFQVTRENPTCLYGPLCVDFFNCEKLLVPDNVLRIKLTRASDDFSIISIDKKKYKAVIEHASLCVRKISITESVKLAIHNAMKISPCRYAYIEKMNKSFIIPAGQNRFSKENLLNNEPVRRLCIAMNLNADFTGTATTNPIHYQKFGLKMLQLMRNGIPVGGTPLDTTYNVRAYFNSCWALGFSNGGHSVPLSDFDDHFVLVFDLTSTQEASQQLTVFPELTGAALNLSVEFGRALTDVVEIFVIAERFTTIFLEHSGRVSKNTLFNG